MPKSTSDESLWGSDVRVSTPEPGIHYAGLTIDFGGIGFSPAGIMFPFTEADREEFYTAPFGPNSVPGPIQ
jgi:hypothetical protein